MTVHFSHEHVEDTIVNTYRTVVIVEGQEPATLIWVKRQEMNSDTSEVILVNIHPDPETLQAMFGGTSVEEIFDQVVANWANA